MDDGLTGGTVGVCIRELTGGTVTVCGFYSSNTSFILVGVSICFII